LKSSRGNKSCRLPWLTQWWRKTTNFFICIPPICFLRHLAHPCWCSSRLLLYLGLFLDFGLLQASILVFMLNKTYFSFLESIWMFNFWRELCSTSGISLSGWLNPGPRG
jgi:hypothetical protein